MSWTVMDSRCRLCDDGLPCLSVPRLMENYTGTSTRGVWLTLLRLATLQRGHTFVARSVPRDNRRLGRSLLQGLHVEQDLADSVVQGLV